MKTTFGENGPNGDGKYLPASRKKASKIRGELMPDVQF